MPTLTLNGVVVTYRVEVRPRRRTAAIQVDAEGRVTVLLPPGRTFSAARLLSDRAEWVVRHVEAALRRPPAPNLEPGCQLLLHGLPLSLDLAPPGRRGWEVTRLGSRLVVGGPADDRAGRRRALALWYLRRAHEELTPMVAGHASRLNARPHRLRLADYRSRWGTCRADGLITLNWRLVGAPEWVADYVAVHELIHLEHPDHQAGFQAALQAALPEAELAREWLREEGHRLHW